MNGITEITILMLVLIILVMTLYLLRKKKIKKDFKIKFKKFSENFTINKDETRTVPRVIIPDSMDVILAFKFPESSILTANIIDLSLSGMLVKTDFSLKKFPINTNINNTRMETPINSLDIERMKSIRIENHPENRLVAFQIQKIDPAQFEKLRTFMIYLDKFLKNEKQSIE